MSVWECLQPVYSALIPKFDDVFCVRTAIQDLPGAEEHKSA